MPPSENNEKGHWESTVLADLNASANDLYARATSALASEFGDTGLPIVKDPRMCRLMRVWTPVFEEAKWSVRALLPLRSPLEVVWSLKRRDDIGPGNGCLTRTLTILCRPICDTITSEAEMHAHPAINELVKETYGAVIKLAEDPSNGGVLRKLDEVRARFESGAAIFDRPMSELEDGILRTRSRAIAERDQYARDLAAECETAAKLAGARDQLAGDLAAERETVAKLAAERDQIAGDLAAERKTAAKLAAERDQIAGIWPPNAKFWPSLSPSAKKNCRPFGCRAKGVCSAASRRQRRT